MQEHAAAHWGFSYATRCLWCREVEERERSVCDMPILNPREIFVANALDVRSSEYLACARWDTLVSSEMLFDLQNTSPALAALHQVRVR